MNNNLPSKSPVLDSGQNKCFIIQTKKKMVLINAHDAEFHISPTSDKFNPNDQSKECSAKLKRMEWKTMILILIWCAWIHILCKS